MPDAAGNFKGQGWSRARARAHARIFGGEAEPEPPADDFAKLREWLNGSTQPSTEAPTVGKCLKP